VPEPERVLPPLLLLDPDDPREPLLPPDEPPFEPDDPPDEPPPPLPPPPPPKLVRYIQNCQKYLSEETTNVFSGHFAAEIGFAFAPEKLVLITDTRHTLTGEATTVTTQLTNNPQINNNFSAFIMI